MKLGEGERMNETRFLTLKMHVKLNCEKWTTCLLTPAAYGFLISLLGRQSYVRVEGDNPAALHC